MQVRGIIHILGAVLLLCSGCRKNESPPTSTSPQILTQLFSVTGIVQSINPADSTVMIAHEAVANYMPAMTMPFQVRDKNLLAQFKPLEKIAFRLTVLSNDSWIDKIQVLGKVSTNSAAKSQSPSAGPPEDTEQYTFTNEFGKSINLTNFNGQALGLTFFFTRCPIPNACPRLSQNFAEASQKLLAMTNMPTNWHFLSISIDPEHDTPEALKAYAAKYHYESNHWSFLTGTPERIAKLTGLFGFEFKPDSGVFTHGFRTVIINPSNQVEQIYPIGGNLSDSIAQDIGKALGVTNR